DQCQSSHTEWFKESVRRTDERERQRGRCRLHWVQAGGFTPFSVCLNTFVVTFQPFIFRGRQAVLQQICLCVCLCVWVCLGVFVSVCVLTVGKKPQCISYTALLSRLLIEGIIFALFISQDAP